ncbi:unnamed protein product [Zymoseptoria tritici ST99CH_1A5]|uniref:BTB domain-containing protein n=1 Tax=Zymoseptoria tritici ST99CH_1A5 TaxID=1276529 RepID=A0A1Y6LVX7_ZYMTR|nr:unnamed protein product [Zymoseptoria tritici ST99CH_1A5]
MGLTADLPLLFNDETYSDLKVHYQGTGDCSHRCIVLPKSKKLRDMCTREKDDLKGVPQYEIDMSSEAAGYAPVGAMLKSMYMSDETQIFEGCTFGECVATFDLAERFGLADLKEATRRALGPANDNLRLGSDVGECMDLIRNLKGAEVSALVDQFLLERMPEFLCHKPTSQWLEGKDTLRYLSMLERRTRIDSTHITSGEDSVFEDSPDNSCVTKAARAMVGPEPEPESEPESEPEPDADLAPPSKKRRRGRNVDADTTALSNAVVNIAEQASSVDAVILQDNFEESAALRSSWPPAEAPQPAVARRKSTRLKTIRKQATFSIGEADEMREVYAGEMEPEGANGKQRVALRRSEGYDEDDEEPDVEPKREKRQVGEDDERTEDSPKRSKRTHDGGVKKEEEEPKVKPEPDNIDG